MNSAMIKYEITRIRCDEDNSDLSGKASIVTDKNGIITQANTAAVNAVTFFSYGLDKWKAARQRRRIPEAWLLGMALATGLVGAWVAMSTFRHKTRKTSFRVKLFFVSVINPIWL